MLTFSELIQFRVGNQFSIIQPLLYKTSSGVQLGIFEGRGRIDKKEHIISFQKKMQPVNVIFQIHKWRNYCGRFTDLVALKTNDSCC